MTPTYNQRDIMPNAITPKSVDAQARTRSNREDIFALLELSKKTNAPVAITEEVLSSIYHLLGNLDMQIGHLDISLHAMLDTNRQLSPLV